MLPDRVSNPGPLTYESDALPIALRGPAKVSNNCFMSPNIIHRHISILPTFNKWWDGLGMGHNHLVFV